MSELLSHGGDDERPPWRPPRWLLSVAVVVVVGALVAGASVLAAGHDGRVRPGATPASATSPTPDLPFFEVPPSDAVALLLPGARMLGTIERRAPRKDQGPWTVTLRQPDGSFARHSAVVTFPVDESAVGHTIRVGAVEGHVDGPTLTWPIAGRHARVRGDLGTPALVAIAELTTTRGGRPVVRPPSGLRVVASGPYGPTKITEARYGFHDDEVSGLVSTGLITGGGFEDAVYAGYAIYPTTVRGRSAVASPVYGGNFVLAWELRPDVVAYIADSGMPLTSETVDALRRVAGRTRLADAASWRATRPTVRDQVTGFDPMG
ncbi:MAG TPA: hypothetical protein VF053_20335 [Streptosporangiales bacterium]